MITFARMCRGATLLSCDCSSSLTLPLLTPRGLALLRRRLWCWFQSGLLLPCDLLSQQLELLPLSLGAIVKPLAPASLACCSLGLCPTNGAYVGEMRRRAARLAFWGYTGTLNDIKPVHNAFRARAPISSTSRLVRVWSSATSA